MTQPDPSIHRDIVMEHDLAISDNGLEGAGEGQLCACE